MLLKKLADKPFVTEFPMPDFDRVEPNPAVKDLAHAKIALVTSGGIVPKGNPDHIESSSASHYGEYDITGVMDLTKRRQRLHTADTIRYTLTKILTVYFRLISLHNEKRELSVSYITYSTQQQVTVQP